MTIDFTAMDGYQFEDYISNLFRKLGFEVEATSYSNDGGVDLVATYKQPIFSGKYIIQCKNWTGPVGQPEVRDLYGVVMDKRANKGILIATSDYTQQAYDFANGKNIELINGHSLRTLLTTASENTKVSTTSKVNDTFRNEQYYYYQKIVNEDPNNVTNYLQVIDYLRDYVKEQNVEMCTIELFDDIIEWTNKMINRCFRTQSKVRDKEMAMMIIAEALIHCGRLAEATEILLRNNRFWIKSYNSSDGTRYRSPNGKYDGRAYDSIYVWNLMAAYNYINYNKGYNLIYSKIDPEKRNTWGYLLEQSLYSIQQFGSQFFYSKLKYTTEGNQKTKHLNTSVIFPEDTRNPNFFFIRFFEKSSDEYAKEIDDVLRIHGII